MKVETETTVGLALYFPCDGEIRTSDFESHKMHREDKSQPFMGLITFTHADGKVNMLVSDHDGSLFVRKNVTIATDGNTQPPFALIPDDEDEEKEGPNFAAQFEESPEDQAIERLATSLHESGADFGLGGTSVDDKSYAVCTIEIKGDFVEKVVEFAKQLKRMRSRLKKESNLEDASAALMMLTMEEEESWCCMSGVHTKNREETFCIAMDTTKKKGKALADAIKRAVNEIEGQ